MNARQALKALFISSLVVLTGCKDYRDSLEFRHFSDTIVKRVDNGGSVVALGGRGIYVLAGEYHVMGKVAKAGTLMGYLASYQYDIYELLAKYPELSNEKVLTAAKKQKDWLTKHGKYETPEAVR